MREICSAWNYEISSLELIVVVKTITSFHTQRMHSFEVGISTYVG